MDPSPEQQRQADWEGRMEAEGWIAVRDIWGHIVAWHHTRTGARIEGANISMWEQTGSTPPSF